MRVLSVTHGPTVGGGVFDELAERVGHRLERWLVPHGGHDEEPEAYDAIMVFGGAMHPDEDARHPWLPGEAGFLGRALAAGVPLLGVCLGAQLIARAAGAWVGPAEASEVGWLPVELTAAGRADPVLSALPENVDAFQWHHYTYKVPEGGVELARSPVATQAFRAGERAWGIQFHAEVTRSMIASWVAEDGGELPVPAAQLLEETDARIGPWNEAGRRLCGAFLGAAAA
jgi:GMP synthase-like glutamine amidotransferase